MKTSRLVPIMVLATLCLLTTYAAAENLFLNERITVPIKPLNPTNSTRAGANATMPVHKNDSSNNHKPPSNEGKNGTNPTKGPGNNNGKNGTNSNKPPQNNGKN